MIQFYRDLHPAGRLGLWGLPVLVLVIVLLVIELREPEVPHASDYPGLVVLEASVNSHRVRLGSPAAQRPLHVDYRPISTATRSRVLQQLAELRALYKQLSLNIRIHTRASETGLQQVARQLNEMLAMNNLGSAAVRESVASGVDTPVVLYCAQGEISIAYSFLSSIAPYLHSQVTVLEDPQLSPGQMQLHLLAKPHFAENGTVVLD